MQPHVILFAQAIYPGRAMCYHAPSCQQLAGIRQRAGSLQDIHGAVNGQNEVEKAEKIRQFGKIKGKDLRLAALLAALTSEISDTHVVLFNVTPYAAGWMHAVPSWSGGMKWSFLQRHAHPCRCSIGTISISPLLELVQRVVGRKKIWLM